MRRMKTAALLAASLLLATTSIVRAEPTGYVGPQDGDKIRRAPTAPGAPEIHPGLWAGGLVLLIGGSLILVSRRRRALPR